MKTLYVVRHAKSSWDFPDLPDVDRPLVEKGINKTKKIIKQLNEKNVKLDLLISSHAKRAHETAKLIAAGIFFPVERIEISRNIYQVDEDKIFNLLFSLNDEVDSVMIVGHNPALTQFANIFLDEKIDLLPTSGVISLEFKTDKWTDIPKASCKTNFVLFPKMLD
ncbi:MAG TPA: histidine phosphatase family protein [Bacteroidales bacterium]|nr:histidine phosphatase family protein [Bacteroidales bacterium]HPS15672.1 histidine phosphatase family protein [Bacteroidales bacterium]